MIKIIKDETKEFTLKYTAYGKPMTNKQLKEYIRKIYPIQYKELNKLINGIGAEARAQYYYHNHLCDRKLYQRHINEVGRPTISSINLIIDCDHPFWKPQFIKDGNKWYFNEDTMKIWN